MGCDLGITMFSLGATGIMLINYLSPRASSRKGHTGLPGSLSLVRKPSVSPLSWRDRTCFLAVNPLTQPLTQCSLRLSAGVPHPHPCVIPVSQGT